MFVPVEKTLTSQGLNPACLQGTNFAAKVFNPSFFNPVNLPSIPSLTPVVDNLPDLFPDLKLAALVSQAIPGLGENISTVGEQLSRSGLPCGFFPLVNSTRCCVQEPAGLNNSGVLRFSQLALLRHNWYAPSLLHPTLPKGRRLMVQSFIGLTLA